MSIIQRQGVAYNIYITETEIIFRWDSVTPLRKRFLGRVNFSCCVGRVSSNRMRDHEIVTVVVVVVVVVYLLPCHIFIYTSGYTFKIFHFN